MRFGVFKRGGWSALGVIHDGKVWDISDVVPGGGKDVHDLIRGGSEAQAAIALALEGGKLSGVPLGEAEWQQPLERPGKIVCLGLNYAEHAREGGADVPSYPAVFLRVASSLLASGEAVVKPTVSDELDFEAELLVIIGKGGSRIPEPEALHHVFGYSIFNDISVRDYQRLTTQWTMGKNFDASGPLGPIVVTADELPAGGSGLAIRSRVNGTVMQDGNTGDMVFSVAKTIALLSEVMTLEPGDMIATGTPAGVGASRKPPVFLRAGDVVEVEIENIGTLSNPVVAA